MQYLATESLIFLLERILTKLFHIVISICLIKMFLSVTLQVTTSCCVTMEQIRATQGTLNILNFNDKKTLQVPREIIESLDSLDEIVEHWNEMFQDTVNRHAPHQPIWVTAEILDCIKNSSKCNINCNNDQCKFLRNKVSTLIRKSKQNTYQKIEGFKDNPRAIWKPFKLFGALVKRGSLGNILGGKLNNSLIFSDKEISYILIFLFAYVASHLKGPIQTSDFHKLKGSC